MTYQSQMTARLLPTHLHSHLLFCDRTDQPKKSKRECKQPHRDTANIDTTPLRTDRRAADNTGLAKVAVQCSADSFVVNQTFVLRINICGKNRHLRQARNRYRKPYWQPC